jgi:hypothetical protein
MPIMCSEQAPDAGRYFLMETSADYRRFAEECRRIQDLVRTERQQKILAEMAQAWEALASQSDGTKQPSSM